MGVIAEFAQKTIDAGAFEALDKVYVENKIRALVGDEGGKVSSTIGWTSG